jgi:hypothetical protein
MSLVLTFNTSYTSDPSTNIGGIVFDVTNSGQTLTSQLTNLGSIPYQFMDSNSKNSNLIGITMSNSITSIDAYAFANCTSLTSIEIPSSVTTFGSYIFTVCSSLTSVTFPITLKTIPYGIFSSCTSLSSVTIPYGVTSINNIAFQGTGLTSITIPNSVTSIGSQVFFYCYYLSSIVLPSSFPRVDDYVFYGCTSLTSITIPSSVTYIGLQAFDGCSMLTLATLPNTISTIYNNAFQNCARLNTFRFMNPSNLSSIGTSIFINTPSMSVIYYNTPGGYNGLNQPSKDLQLQFTANTTFTYFPGGPTPTITNFPNITKQYNDPSFVLATPTSDSNGAFTYTIADQGLADICGNVVTPKQFGTTSITATQAATSEYSSGSISAVLQINTNFPNLNKLLTDASFTLVNPPSNSSGAFTYSTSNTGVVSVAGNVVTIQNPGITTITATQDASGSYGVGTANTYLNIMNNICFPAGTPITCDQGNISIERLNTEIHTIRGKKIVAITQTITPDKFLICFEKDSLGANIPSQKTLISKKHKVFYKGKMMEAQDFVGKFDSVYRVKYSGEILYNVLMGKYEKMMVNNLICETLHPENIVARLYTGNYSPSEFNEIVLSMNECVKKQDRNKFLSICKRLK